MSHTSKPMTKRDDEQVLRSAYNEVNGTLAVDGFLTGKVGHKVTLAISTTNVANDTETYEYFDGATSLFSIEIIYTDGTRSTMLSAERVS